MDRLTRREVKVALLSAFLGAVLGAAASPLGTAAYARLTAPAVGDLVVTLQTQGHVQPSQGSCLLEKASVWQAGAPLEAFRDSREVDPTHECAWNGVPVGPYRVALFGPANLTLFTGSTTRTFWGEVDVVIPGHVDVVRSTPFLAETPEVIGVRHNLSFTVLNPGPSVVMQFVCLWGAEVQNETVDPVTGTISSSAVIHQSRPAPGEIRAGESRRESCNLGPNGTREPLVAAMVRVRSPFSSDDGGIHAGRDELPTTVPGVSDWLVTDTWRLPCAPTGGPSSIFQCSS